MEGCRGLWRRRLQRAQTAREAGARVAAEHARDLGRAPNACMVSAIQARAISQRRASGSMETWVFLDMGGLSPRWLRC